MSILVTISVSAQRMDIEELHPLCESLAERFSGSSVQKITGFWSAEGSLSKDSYDSISKESGFEIKVLVEQPSDLPIVQELVRENIFNPDVRWVQVISSQVITHHVLLERSEGSL
jgi:uncharacterized protein YmfQ (DUF2313 family)